MVLQPIGERRGDHAGEEERAGGGDVEHRDGVRSITSEAFDPPSAPRLDMVRLHVNAGARNGFARDCRELMDHGQPSRLKSDVIPDQAIYQIGVPGELVHGAWANS